MPTEELPILYKRTEIGWPVILVVVVLLSYIQAMSVITDEPRLMLYITDAVIVLVTIPFFTLAICVSNSAIVWCLSFGLFPQSIQIESVLSAEIISLSFIQGFGVRGFGANRLWRVSGSKAVRIELTDKRTIALGVADPDQLKEAIVSAMTLARSG